MKIFSVIMLLFLIFSAIAVSAIRSLLGAIIIFIVYSLIMTMLWQQLNAPDLAITEAALGAGVTTILFIIALRKIKG